MCCRRTRRRKSRETFHAAPWKRFLECHQHLFEADLVVYKQIGRGLEARLWERFQKCDRLNWGLKRTSILQLFRDPRVYIIGQFGLKYGRSILTVSIAFQQKNEQQGRWLLSACERSRKLGQYWEPMWELIFNTIPMEAQEFYLENLTHYEELMFG